MNFSNNKATITKHEDHYIDSNNNRCDFDYFGSAAAAYIAICSLVRCFGCINCENCFKCENCTNSKNCVRCDDLSDGENCFNCVSAKRLKNCVYAHFQDDAQFAYGQPKVDYLSRTPVTVDYLSRTSVTVDNLHKRVANIVTGHPERLDMDTWHSDYPEEIKQEIEKDSHDPSCGTTHCWAGMIVHLAGVAGYQLEIETNAAFAAQLICYWSTGETIPMPYFFLSNVDAAQKMRELAQLNVQ